MTIKVLAAPAAAFLLGAMTFAGCSNSDTVVANNAVASDAGDDGGEDSGCVEVDACVTCPAFIAGLDAGEVLPTCKCDTAGGKPSSSQLYAAIQECICQDSCVSECLTVCADGPANDTCSSCADSKCASEYSACYAQPIVTSRPDAGMPATNDASTVDDGGDSDDASSSPIDSGRDSGNDAATDTGADSGIRDAAADG